MVILGALDIHMIEVYNPIWVAQFLESYFFYTKSEIWIFFGQISKNLHKFQTQMLNFSFFHYGTNKIIQFRIPNIL